MAALHVDVGRRGGVPVERDCRTTHSDAHPLSRTTPSGLPWDTVDAQWSWEHLPTERVYGRPAALTRDRAEPDPIRMHLKLKRPDVTLELLHIEYEEAHPDGPRRGAGCFCRLGQVASRRVRGGHTAAR